MEIINRLLLHRRFKNEFREYLLQRELKDKKTFSNVQRKDNFYLEWDNFFRLHDFFQLQKKLDKLVANLDDWSKEIATRVLLTHVMQHLEGVFLMFDIQFLENTITPDFFPLDKKERERMNSMKKSFTNKFVFMNSEKNKKIVIEDEIFLNNYGLIYFSPDTQKIINNRDVIDGGGFAGDTAMLFSELPVKNVYVFEPHPGTFQEMKKNILLNSNTLGDNIHKITPVQSALGKSNGNMKLYSNGNCDNSSTVHNRKGKKEYNVPVTSIDDYVKEHSLNVGLIKLDVEGEESNVIEGAIETIKTQKPLLLISIYHTPQDFFEIKCRLESLNIGYKFMIRQTVTDIIQVSEVCLLGYPE
jgi:FkbM family methyltransferase